MYTSKHICTYTVPYHTSRYLRVVYISEYIDGGVTFMSRKMVVSEVVRFKNTGVGWRENEDRDWGVLVVIQQVEVLQR